MKTRIIALAGAALLTVSLAAGCGGKGIKETAAETTTDGAEKSTTASLQETLSAGSKESKSDESLKTATAGSKESETTELQETAAGGAGKSETTELQETATAVPAAQSEAVLEDGIYSADFDTDSSMFRVNETCSGKGTLTVKDGKMSIHITLTSKNIVNLYRGLAEDAKKDGAKLLNPTTDPVTYSDGITEEVYGFDVPVPVLDEEFDLALVGTKGTWYDHKVTVSNPEKLE